MTAKNYKGTTMCEVCAIFGAGEHWSDFARLRDERYPFDDILHYREERKRRISILNQVLSLRGLSCEDWDGEALAIVDRAGRFEMAPTLSDVWPAADRLDPGGSDPLSGVFGQTDALKVV